MKESKTYDFGEAIRLLKHGHKVARRGWNGKGMFVMFCEAEGEPYTLADGTEVTRRDYLYMKAADSTVVPWVASQTDILANDWYIAAERLHVNGGLPFVSTADLVAELEKRQGVDVHYADPYSTTNITVDGPAVIAIITD